MLQPDSKQMLDATVARAHALRDARYGGGPKRARAATGREAALPKAVATFEDDVTWLKKYVHASTDHAAILELAAQIRALRDDAPGATAAEGHPNVAQTPVADRRGQQARRAERGGAPVGSAELLVTKHGRFRIRKVQGDGNCFYHAIVTIAKRDVPDFPAHAQRLRSAMRAYVEENGDTLRGQAGIFKFDDVDAMMARLAKKDAWAQDDEIRLVSLMYDTCIFVHSKEGSGAAYDAITAYSAGKLMLPARCPSGVIWHLMHVPGRGSGRFVAGVHFDALFPHDDA